MLIRLLPFILLGILLISFAFDGKRLTSPPVVFCSGFLLSSICAVYFSGQWQFKLHPSTFVTLVGGISLFSIICISIHKLYNHMRGVKRGNKFDSPGLCALPGLRTAPLALFCILQLFVTVSVLIQISSFFPDLPVFHAIGAFKSSKTFTIDNLTFPFPLNQVMNLCKAAGYLFAFLLAKTMADKKINLSGVCLLVNFLFSAVLGFIVGGRNLGLSYVVCLFVSWLLCRAAGGRREINGKVLVILVVSVAVFVGLLQFLSFGRSGSIRLKDYIGIYLGAPLANLDAYLQNGHFGGSSPFGRMTFFCWYTYIGYKFGITDWMYTFDLPFQMRNGFDMGNVYTTFYSYIYDFGYIGMVLLVIAMAVISQVCYEKAALRGGVKYNWPWLLIYSFISYQLLFSFFSNKFYEEVLTPGFITSFVYCAVAAYAVLFFSPRAILNIIGTKTRRNKKASS